MKIRLNKNGPRRQSYRAKLFVTFIDYFFLTYYSTSIRITSTLKMRLRKINKTRA
jgi:hypothetical protein